MALDEFKPAHPLLEAKFRQFMDAYLLSSDGSTTSTADKTSGGGEGGRVTSALEQEMGFWQREWRRRKTDRTRLELLRVMQEAVTRLKYAPDNSAQPGTLEWRQKIAFDEREPHVVQDTYGISRATYYRIRGSLNLSRPRRR